MNENRYQFWLASVKQRLVHPDAIRCVVGADPNDALRAFCEHGFSVKRVARELNDRYEDGYLERRTALKAGAL